MAQIDVNKWWSEVAKDSGLSEEEAKAVAATLTKESVVKRFQSDFVDRPTFSRELNDRDAKIKEKETWAQKYYQDGNTLIAQHQAAREAAEAKAKRYAQEYGELSDDGTVKSPTTLDPSKFISREDYTKELERIQNQSLYVTKEVTRAMGDHIKRFGEPLDLDEFEKFALERKLDVRTAYGEFIKPRVETLQTSEFEKKLKEAREEGAREAMSRMKVPVDASPKEPAPFYTSLIADRSKGVSEQDRISGFAEAWHNANATKS